MAKDMYQKREDRKNKAKNNELENKTNINWYPGHMAKTKREILEKLDLIDVVYEVVDARIPYSSKIKDIDTFIKNKPRILIMSKIDLCDMSVTKKWITYYEEQGYKVVALDLEHNTNLNELFKKTNELMIPINEKRLNKGLKERKTKVLVVGIPNAGKSTLINRLVGRKAVNVGNRPGITKNIDWIRINNDLELMDTPGILWPKFEDQEVALRLASLTAIKEEILPIDKVVVFILEMLEKYYPNILLERYGLECLDEDIIANYEHIGKKRGCLIKGGEIDYDKVNTIVLNDIKTGIIRGITFDRK